MTVLAARPGGPRHGKRSPLRLGMIIAVISLGLLIPIFLRQQIAVLLTPGDVVTVHFAADNYIRPFKTEAKVAGVPVGTVTSVDAADDGSAVMRVKISGEAYQALGSAPSATIRPTTLLGGRYYIDLVPGGLPGGGHPDLPHPPAGRVGPGGRHPPARRPGRGPGRDQ
jgi:phospholipid/cholesterol/gamma-HCH transport system substrate-binding protein